MTTTSPLSPVNHLRLVIAAIKLLVACARHSSKTTPCLTRSRGVYQRCTPRQLPLSGRQRTDLVAAAVLPPHTADFPLQLLDVTHTWSTRSDNDIRTFDILPLAAGVSIYSLKRIPGGPTCHGILAHFPNCLRQSQNSSPGASPTTLQRFAITGSVPDTSSLPECSTSLARFARLD